MAEVMNLALIVVGPGNSDPNVTGLVVKARVLVVFVVVVAAVAIVVAVAVVDGVLPFASTSASMRALQIHSACLFAEKVQAFFFVSFPSFESSVGCHTPQTTPLLISLCAWFQNSARFQQRPGVSLFEQAVTQNRET